LQAADVELATGDGAEQAIIVGMEEVETRIRASFLLDGLREFVQLVAPVAGILDGGQELQIAPVGRLQQFPQRRRNIELGLLLRSPAVARRISEFLECLMKAQVLERLL